MQRYNEGLGHSRFLLTKSAGKGGAVHMVVQPVSAVAVALLNVGVRRLPPCRDAVLSLIPLVHLEQNP